jgi:hypothetical protein
MGLRAGVTCVDEVAGAFGGCDAIEDPGDSPAEGGAGSLGGAAQPVRPLGEQRLDRIGVWRVVRQEQPRYAGGAALCPRGHREKPLASTAWP